MIGLNKIVKRGPDFYVSNIIDILKAYNSKNEKTKYVRE